MTSAPQQPPAGWYPDPAGSDGERFWDGVAWSQATRDQPVADVAPEQPSPPLAPYGGYAGAPAAEANPAGQPAPFIFRAGGLVIDYVVYNFVLQLILSATTVGVTANGEMNNWLKALRLWADGNGAGPFPMPSEEFMGAALTLASIGLVVLAVYRVVLLGLFNATLGQMVFRLRTVKLGAEPGAKLGWGTATVRGLVGALFYQHFVLGFINGIFAAFTPKKQTLSDMISKTQVLKIR